MFPPAISSLSPPQAQLWLGPYKGMGAATRADFKPYRPDPPYPAYASAHSAISAAAAESLTSFFNGNASFVGPRCARLAAGASRTEPRIASGQLGFLKGVTDVANKGPATVGYAPADVVVTCHGSWPAAAEAAGISRQFSGNALLDDNVDGLLIGRLAGQYVYNKAFRLWNHAALAQYAAQRRAAKQQQAAGAASNVVVPGEQALFRSAGR